MVTLVIDISIIMFFIIALVAVRKNALYEIDYGKIPSEKKDSEGK